MLLQLLLQTASTFALVLVLAGWGSLFFGGKSTARAEERGLAGIIVLFLLGAAANFFLPLSSWITAPVMVFGLVLSAYFHSRTRMFTWKGIFVFLGLSLLATLISTSARPHIDTGLYHVPIIKWLVEDPIRPGLANIHERLGFNSAWHVAAAMLSLDGAKYFLPFTLSRALGVLVLVFFLVEWRAMKREPDLPGVFSVLVLGFLCVSARGFSNELGTLSTDMPSAMLALVCMQYFIKLSRNACSTVPRQMLMILPVFAVTIKLTQSPVLLLGVFAVVMSKKIPATATVVAISTLALWCLRNLALSGCWFYPAALSCINTLPWTITTDHIGSTLQMITIRDPSDTVAAGQGGLTERWITGFLHSKMVLLLLLSFFSGCVLLAGFRRIPGTIFLLASAAAATGVVFWFVESPSIRFGISFLAAAAMLPLAQGLAWLFQRHRKPAGYFMHLAAPGAAAVLIIRALAAFVPAAATDSTDYRQWPHIEKTAVITRTSDYGVEITSSKTANQNCWDAPKPCAAFASARIKSGRFFIWDYYAAGAADKSTNP